MADNSISAEERQKYLEQFAKNVVRDAKLELDAKQPRRTVSAVWKKGRPVSWKVKTRRFVPNTTGKLKESIRYEIKEIGDNIIVIFYAEQYWYYVNFGRKGILIDPTKPGQKAAPPQAITRWTANKGLRPRDADGKFLPVNRRNVAAMNYMINRKIKWFGISGTQFWSKTMRIYLEQMEQELGKRIAKDLLNSIAKWPLT
jgi:hypothetical protein